MYVDLTWLNHIWTPFRYLVTLQWFTSYNDACCANCPLRLAHSCLADYPAPRIDTSHRTSHFTTSQTRTHRRKLPPNSVGGGLWPFPSPPLPSPSFPFPLLPFALLRSRAPQIQLGGLGERCKLPQRGLGQSPSRNRIWCILDLKSDIWWPQF